MESSKRYNLPNHIHELTFSCFKRRPLLTSDRTCSNLAHAVTRVSEKLNFSVIAYVFMPTHVHLLVNPEKSEYSISEFLQKVKQPVSRKEIAHLKHHAPDKLSGLSTGWDKPKYLLWMRGGGFDRNIIDPDYIENSIRYIHNNPVRKRLVDNVLDWKWSSVRDWELDEQGPIPVLKNLRY